MSEQFPQQCLELFARQEREFGDWVKTYYQTAYYFYCLREQLGVPEFHVWLGDNLREDQIVVVKDMLLKLKNTAKGKAIMATVRNPEEFVFPQ